MKPLTILALLAFAGCSAHNNLAPMPNVTQPPIGNATTACHVTHDTIKWDRFRRDDKHVRIQAPWRLLGRLGRGPQRHEQRHVRPWRQQR